MPLLLALGAFGLGVLFVGTAIVSLSDNNGGSANGLPTDAPATVSASPTPRPTATRSTEPTATRAPTQTATPRPTTTPVPVTPIPATPVAPATGIWTWSRVSQSWLQSPLTAQNSNYREGESVPLMLVAENATAGATYSVRLTYDCKVGEAAAIDFISDGGSDALMGAQAAPGPQRGMPDATAVIPDDSSISADNQAARSISLWGGTFQTTPVGPDPDSPCEGTKTIDLRIRAVLDTLYVVWGAHLAQDATAGSSTVESAIVLEARLGSGPVRSAEIDPGAVSR